MKRASRSTAPAAGANVLRGGLREARAGGARGETFHLVKFLPRHGSESPPLPPPPGGKRGSVLRQQPGGWHGELAKFEAEDLGRAARRLGYPGTYPWVPPAPDAGCRWMRESRRLACLVAGACRVQRGCSDADGCTWATCRRKLGGCLARRRAEQGGQTHFSRGGEGGSGLSASQRHA